MANRNEDTKKRLRIGFGKDVKTEHFPVDVASGLDVLLAQDGYKRVSKTRANPEEFIWENDKEERLSVNYYTQIDTITCSAIFDEDLSVDREDTIRRLNALYSNLNATIGAISQHLGFPYVSTTRELRIEIKGNGLAKKTQFLIPIIRDLYSKIEGVQLFNVDTLEKTNSSMQIIFGSQE